MNTKFIVSKNYNHFFFVQTLSNWHFSCRPEYINSWIKKTGPLTSKEKNSLKSFKLVIEKYGFKTLNNCTAANAYDFFMRFDEYKNSHPFSKKEIAIYLDTMTCLDPRYEKIWEHEGKKLKRIEKLLRNRYNKTQSEVISDLKVLFGDRVDLGSKIEIILLLSAEGCGVGGGGANNGPNAISLECSGANAEDTNYILSTLWHELTHLFLDNYFNETASLMYKNNIIKEASLDAKKIDFNYSEELISFSVFSPMSFLTKKYFSTEIAEKLSNSVMQEDSDWLLKARHIFVMYLIYLNGQFIKQMLEKKQSISPEKMAKAVVDNHKIVKDYFASKHKKLIWFKYD